MPILEGRIAIITGSSRGIGRAIAIAFAREGCKVVVNYRHSREKALEVAAEIEKIHPTRPCPPRPPSSRSRLRSTAKS